MSTLSLNKADLRSENIDKLIEKHKCNPFHRLSKIGNKCMKFIVEPTIHVGNPVGRLITNQSGESWIEAALWKYNEKHTDEVEYLHCDGTWNMSTECPSYYTNEFIIPHTIDDAEDEIPVSSDKDRRFKGWFNSQIQLLEAYYLYLYKDKILTSTQYYLVKALCRAEELKLKGIE